MTWTPDRIKSLRTRLGVTQEELARLLGYGPNRDRVWRLEHDRRSPSGPVQVTLERLDEARLDPDEELRRIA